MWIIVGILALGVVYLAIKSPDVNTNENREKLPPNTDIASLGSVGNPSPAMSLGAPAIGQPYRMAMTVNAGPVTSAAPQISAPASANPLLAGSNVFRPPTQTVSEMGKTLMTQAPPSLASVTNTTLSGRVIKL